MEKFLMFITNHYLVFVLITVVLIISLVGYVVQYSHNKVDDNFKNKENEQVNPNVNNSQNEQIM